MKRIFVVLLALAPALIGEIVPGRYIVELTGDSVSAHVARRRARGGVRGAEGQARRTALRAEQEQARQRMGGRVAVLGRMETVGNALLVEADEAEAVRLAGLPGVKRVAPVRTLRRFLDRAVGLNGITRAWEQVGDDRAGEGVKIAIVDTGVDNAHEGLRDAGLAMPEGYPKTNAATDEAFTNAKVIVARSYVHLLVRRDGDMSARDRVGHGTALAMAAAGSRTAGPWATIQGVAPRAYIGSYKVFGSPGVNDGATNAAILQAIDDAVADGMDIINLSLGDDFAARLEDDPLVAAVEEAVKAGVLVVCAAGNNGPDFGTVSSPATAPSAITVGATRNDRTFGTSVEIEGVGAVPAVRGSGIAPENPVAGPVEDVAGLDTDGLACGTLPSGSLTGKVALILRGTCTFEDKLNNAQRAGAIAALVYATAAEPDPFTMGVGAASLPAEMISHADGLRLKERTGTTVSLRFTVGAIEKEADRIALFSSIGPSVDRGMKPDLVAVGESFYTATQSYDPSGDMYSATGFTLVDGTSFSAPVAAGALALLTSARPGLSVAQYRSLLLHSAGPVAGAGIQQAGAGQMQLGASVQARVAASPGILVFNGEQAVLRLDNLGAEGEVYSLIVEPRGEGVAAVLPAGQVEVPAGGSGEVAVTMGGEGSGVIRVVGASGEIRVPYWRATEGGEAAVIPVLGRTVSGRRGGLVRNVVYFRVVNAAGLPVAGVVPELSVVAGEGSGAGVTSLDRESPGLFSAAVRLGALAGVNTYRIQAGGATLEFSVTGQ